MENQVVETKNTEVIIKDQAVETPITETAEQINWKKFREQREVERKQKEAAENLAAQKHAETEALKAAMEAILNKNNNNSNDYNRASEYSHDDESEDQKIQKKINAALEARDKQYEQQRMQHERDQLPQKLTQTYKDFNQVCTQENLDYLEYHYPEVAKAFKYAPDGFEKWSDVYQTVKRFVPNSDSKKDQIKAEKNFSKPQSMSVGGVTQTGDTAPMQLDDKRRADNWARMQRIMKGGK